MLNRTVLLVERDPAQADQILDLFRKNNFRNPIVLVGSKSEALDYIFRTGPHAGRPDGATPGLILLDLWTNKTRDMELLKPLQSYLRTESIPIVILTSSPEQEREIDEYHFGSIGFIRKPLDFTHLVEVVQTLGMRWPAGEPPG